MESPARRNYVNDEDILVSSLVPQELRCLFKYDRFNSMQSEIANDVLGCDDNLTVASPTGSGKTVIHELAIVRMIMKVSSGSIRTFKCVYIAPNKALCQQKTNEWIKSFGSIGVKVMEITGDVDMSDGILSVAKANIIITTPEKWDYMTRQWRQHLFLFGSIDALLLDEIHHLGDDRGATLEIIIVRMRLLHQLYLDRTARSGAEESKHTPLRVIALSATLPNLGDIGSWLHCRAEKIHHFGDDFRPIPLTTHVLSYYKAPSCNQFLFEKGLNDKVAEVIRKYSDNRQTLVFCSSKSGAEQLARQLSDKIRVPPADDRSSGLESRIAAISDAGLRSLVQAGFAYHHAGLPPADKDLVEDLYLRGRVHVLCSTSTLAHGVNLPAHLVVIKGTSSWRGGGRGYERSPRSEIIQMTGRAGRPGFDSHGVAVIMTSDDQKDYYSDTSLNADTVESKLPAILIEAICSEVTQTVIGSLRQAEQWLKSTFLFVRMQQNPRYYGLVVPKAAPGSEELEQHYSAMARDCCLRAINVLAGAKIITFCDSSAEIAPLPEAHIMTRNIIKFETMKTLMAVPAGAGMREVLLELCKAAECGTVVRRDEKRTLNHLMTLIRYPLKAKVQSGAQKAYVLTQAVAVDFYISDFTLRVEQSEILRWTNRIVSALSQLSYERGVGSLMALCVLIERGLRAHMWESDFDTVFMQLQSMGGAAGIEASTGKQLVKSNVTAPEDVLHCSAAQLQQRLGGCPLRDAQNVLDFSRALLELKLSVRASASPAGGMMIDIFPAEEAPVTPSAAAGSGFAPEYTPSYQLVVYDMPSSQLLLHRSLKRPLRAQQTFEVPPLGPVQLADVKVCLLSDLLVGFDALQLNADRGSPAKVPTKAPAKAPAKVPAQMAPDRAMPVEAPATGRSSILSYMRERPPQQDTRGKENAPPVQQAVARGSSQRGSNPFDEYTYSPARTANSDPGNRFQPIESRPVEQQSQPTPLCSQSSGFVSRTLPVPRELDMLRAKACELQLENVPVKRLRTAAPWRESVSAAPRGFLGGTPGAHDFQRNNPNVWYGRPPVTSGKRAGRFNYNATEDFDEEVPEMRSCTHSYAAPVEAGFFSGGQGAFFDSAGAPPLALRGPAERGERQLAGSARREVRAPAAPQAEGEHDLFLASFF